MSTQIIIHETNKSVITYSTRCIMWFSVNNQVYINVESHIRPSNVGRMQEFCVSVTRLESIYDIHRVGWIAYE